MIAWQLFPSVIIYEKWGVCDAPIVVIDSLPHRHCRSWRLSPRTSRAGLRRSPPSLTTNETHPHGRFGWRRRGRRRGAGPAAEAGDEWPRRTSDGDGGGCQGGNRRRQRSRGVSLAEEAVATAEDAGGDDGGVMAGDGEGRRTVEDGGGTNGGGSGGGGDGGGGEGGGGSGGVDRHNRSITDTPVVVDEYLKEIAVATEEVRGRIIRRPSMWSQAPQNDHMFTTNAVDASLTPDAATSATMTVSAVVTSPI